MGVMACVREDCDNILCDRYSLTYGYICNECFHELTEYLNARGSINPEVIQEFLGLPKGTGRRYSAAVLAFLEQEFPVR